MGLIDRLLGNTSEQQIKKIKPLLNKINALEDGVKALSDEQLRGKTAEFRERLQRERALMRFCPRPTRWCAKLRSGRLASGITMFR